MMPTDPRPSLFHTSVALTGWWGIGLLLMAVQCGSPAADDPYQAWGLGRPQEAMPLLLKQAQQSDHWDAWFDAGVAAAAAGDRGRAVSWLLAAHRLAPERDEPRTALRALGIELPQTWLDRIGPVGWPGSGWPAVLLLATVGIVVGYACLARRRSRPVLALGLIAGVVAAPGLVATWLDHRTDIIAVVHATHLPDSAGNPEEAVAAGTPVVRDPQPTWSGRMLVTLLDGKRGYLPIADTRSENTDAIGAP
jgi:hypothetical protein